VRAAYRDLFAEIIAAGGATSATRRRIRGMMA
jgi:hypothetical protein